MSDRSFFQALVYQLDFFILASVFFFDAQGSKSSTKNDVYVYLPSRNLWQGTIQPMLPNVHFYSGPGQGSFPCAHKFSKARSAHGIVRIFKQSFSLRSYVESFHENHLISSLP